MSQGAFRWPVFAQCDSDSPRSTPLPFHLISLWRWGVRVYTDAARDTEAIGLGHHLVTDDLSVADRRWLQGSYTSMEAEYIALLDGIRYASYEGRGSLEVYTDCEPLVKKMEYPDHKSEEWRDRRVGCQRLLEKFDNASIEWIPRSNNERANRMAYEALEEARRS